MKIQEQLNKTITQLQELSIEVVTYSFPVNPTKESELLDKLLTQLISLMVAQDSFDIIDNQAYDFLESILRGEGWVGYHNLYPNELITEFLERIEYSGETLQNTVDTLVVHKWILPTGDTGDINQTDDTEVVDITLNELVNNVNALYQKFVKNK